MSSSNPGDVSSATHMLVCKESGQAFLDRGSPMAKTMGFSACKKKEISLISAKKKTTFSFDILFSEEGFHFSNKEEKTRVFEN